MCCVSGCLCTFIWESWDYFWSHKWKNTGPPPIIVTGKQWKLNIGHIVWCSTHFNIIIDFLSSVDACGLFNVLKTWYLTSGSRVETNWVSVMIPWCPRRHFLRHYDHYSHKTWHSAKLWQGASEHIILSNLHLRKRPTGDDAKYWKTQNRQFLFLNGEMGKTLSRIVDISSPLSGLSTVM